MQFRTPPLLKCDVTVSYIDKNGAPLAADETESIPGYSNKVFYQADNASLPANFIGAATVTGTGNIAVVTNLYNAGTSSSNAQLLSYDGFAGGDTTLLVPRFVRRFYGYNSGMSIQNLGAAATTVTIEFTFAGTAYTYTSPEILPGAALPLYATTIAEIAAVDALPMSQRFGSAVITSGGENIIAIVNEDNRGNAADNNGDPVAVERISQGITYNAFLDGSQTTTAFFAQIVAGAGGIFSGGFQVVNTTATDTTCTATFNAQAGFSYDFELLGNASASVYAPLVPGIVQPYNGSVTVVCGQAIVGISNLADVVGSGLVGDSFTCTNGLNR